MPRTLTIVGLFALAAVLRLHNAWAALPLSGFDGPFHAAYVGIIHYEGRLPSPYESWSTFHPPLYYALCALLWDILPTSLDSRGVLFALRAINVAAGLGVGLAVWASARLLLPARPAVALYATAVALFLPMVVAPSSLLGNEFLAMALSALAVLLLLRTMAAPRPLWYAAILGAVLGLAVLSKISALVVLAAAVIALSLRGRRYGDLRPPAWKAPAVVGLAFLLVTAWYFAGNLARHGVPVVTEVENSVELMAEQGFGSPRPLRAYVSLRPDILLNPADRSPRATGAVWPVTFATIWFDVHGTMIRVRSVWAKRFSRALFTCGAVITAIASVGLAAVLAGRTRLAVPFGALALVILAALSVASYVAFTYRVATFSVLKGTYLAPGLVPFALFAGIGFDALAARGEWASRLLRVFLAVFVLAVVCISWSGWLAPQKVNPAQLYLQAYSDAPSQRVFEYFVEGRRVE
ncbi:glycosyltransferase family 39 protein [bacterium]|nr:glycosyltransferase family 39 protein [bacterium]